MPSQHQRQSDKKNFDQRHSETRINKDPMFHLLKAIKKRKTNERNEQMNSRSIPRTNTVNQKRMVPASRSTIRLSALILGLGVSLLAPRAGAQSPPAKSGVEMKNLGIFTGKWKLDEVDEASPFGPAGKAVFETEIRFVHNGFFMEERGRGQLAGEPMAYTIIYHYDSAVRVYRNFYYDSSGLALFSEASFEGRTWTGRWKKEVNGKSYRGKGVTVVAPDGKTFTYDWTYSGDDGKTWKPMFKGTAKKIGD